MTDNPPLIWKGHSRAAVYTYLNELAKAESKNDYNNLLRKIFLTTSAQKEYWLDDDNNIMLHFSDELIARTSPWSERDLFDKRFRPEDHWLERNNREVDRMSYSANNSNVTLLHDPITDVFYFDECDEIIFKLATSGLPKDHKYI